MKASSVNHISTEFIKGKTSQLALRGTLTGSRYKKADSSLVVQVPGGFPWDPTSHNHVGAPGDGGTIIMYNMQVL